MASRLTHELRVVRAAALLLGAAALCLGSVWGDEEVLLTDQIHMRDPWVLPHDGIYHLFGTTGDAWGKEGGGFIGYRSTDLTHWTVTGQALPVDGKPAWADYHFWAPELYERDGRFHLCFSGKTDHSCRGTGMAVSDSPLGPFRPLSDTPLTPPDWECLDGHLFRDTDGTEWFIFVHEWVQAPLGEMWIQRISPDYTQLVGEKHLLFRGEDAPWSNKVIDGPMMVVEDGRYHLFWSSFNEQDGYCCGVATADALLGPYTQSAEPVIRNDGGHNCVFRGFDGQLYTSFHRPNKAPDERVRIERLDYIDGRWVTGEFGA